MRESYKYAVQTPFISFVKIEETFKTEFAINALKVWELFDTISGFHYCPVITYFAEEELLRFIRKLVILPGTDFDVGTAPRYRECLDRIYHISIDMTRIGRFNEQYPETCIEWWWFLMRLITLVQEGQNLALPILREIQEACSGLLDLFARRRNGSDKDDPVDKLVEFLEFLIDVICPYHDQDPDVESGGKEEAAGKKRWRTMMTRVHTKYGCYTPPEFWEWLKRHEKLYELTIRRLGIPPNIQISDLPSVFIYPFLISRRFDRIVDDYLKGLPDGGRIDKNRLKRELFLMVFTHEHAHALDRHGIDRNVEKKELELWTDTRNQANNTRWREHMPWITEGIAMYFENEYIERLTSDDVHLQKLLQDEFAGYVDARKDLVTWPYHGYRLLKEHMTTKYSIQNLLYDWKRLTISKKHFKALIRGAAMYHASNITIGQINDWIQELSST